MAKSKPVNKPEYNSHEVFGPPRALRRGSISQRWVKCGKPGCPCATDKDARHGPYPSLSVVVNGRSKTIHLNREEFVIVSRQIEEYGKIKGSFEDWVDDCEKLAKQELESLRQETAEKKGSKRRSRRVLRPRSKS